MYGPCQNIFGKNNIYLITAIGIEGNQLTVRHSSRKVLTNLKSYQQVVKKKMPTLK